MPYETFYVLLKKLTDNNCQSCLNNCCDVTKYLITLEEDDLGTFVEKGLKTYSLEQMNLNSLLGWYENRDEVVFDNNSCEIQKPALLQTVDGNWVIYAERYCPHFSLEQRCSIIDDDRRPKNCVKFPAVGEPDKFLKDGFERMRFVVDQRCPVSTPENLGPLVVNGVFNDYEVEVRPKEK